ncbi:MAG: biosynthetic-type acetolactate synthase large subunit [Ardenticatenia bacterium]|uniref:Acetolactate synthase n=1 Tax=Ardenticatena maritima TaxID=872965 RepID=A0A0M9UDM1_9CHLR|nr:biosynthetic-type acetolactate synthase large subunit [Ardenticatena maritima]KPL88477.1 acetolactate synthase catalytic subunit [Ardenticatena maritima]RME11167.1 MAG: biosynthetic-type acetolactate synthase large subunit [Ardenticatenia bacterium]GAP64168.1 acetolactate synthase I/II/III large subunit [Ardenticatena maritima]
MQLTGAEIIWECLIREGVEVVFGYPGGAILPTYDALSKYPQIHHVLVRHEQGATHAADGYARASGKVGVAMATSGPGATNMVTGLATAMMDSVPIVCITGQVPTSAIGSDAFQETDVTGVTLPVTKHNYLVTDVRDLAYIIREAFHIARSGRPGPVLIDIPKDVQNATTEFVFPDESEIRLPGYRPETVIPPEQFEQAIKLINSAERPVILAGHGVLMSNAMRELREFAEKAQIPVAQTLLGLGNFPASHPLCLGMMGMHGEAYVNQAIQEADLLLAFGMRFDDRVTGNVKTYAPKARKIHIEIDPTELNKNVKVDVGIIGDLREVLQHLLPHVEPRDRSAWLARIDEWREDTRRRDILNVESGDKLWAVHVIHDLWKATHGQATVVTDVGQHQMWEAQYYHHERPFSLITSGGLGTMGFALPAAIGASFARPDEEIWAVVGDGGFQMTLCELATAVQEKRRVRIAIINNGYLGMVRQWQEIFYGRRYNATPLVNPDFVKLAEAYGIPAFRVERREDVLPTIEAARAVDGPALIDFVVEREEMVYPMVPSGADLHNMIRRPLANERTEVHS